jgi:hypothetical protein
VWHTADFDSPVEVLLWRLDESDVLPYGDESMLKLSGLVGKRKVLGLPAATDEAMGHDFPAIMLLLTATVDDDGKPRQTATLTIVCEDGLFKGGLRDRDANASLWRSGATLKALFTSLESQLQSGAAEWRNNEKSRK